MIQGDIWKKKQTLPSIHCTNSDCNSWLYLRSYFEYLGWESIQLHFAQNNSPNKAEVVLLKGHRPWWKFIRLWNTGPLGKSRFANHSSTTCMWTIAIAKVLPGVAELQREAVIHKLSQKLVILRPCWESFKNEIREFRWKILASPTPPVPLPSQRMQWNTFHQRHCVRISHSTQHKDDLKTFLLSDFKSCLGHTNKMELQVVWTTASLASYAQSLGVMDWQCCVQRIQTYRKPFQSP